MLDKKRTAGSKFRYLRNVNVRWDNVDVSDLLEMPFMESEIPRFSLSPGDVLICEGGEPGRCAVWNSNDASIKYQKALHRVRPAGGILPRWLVFHIYFDALRGALLKYLTGTTIKHLPREVLQEYVVELAPIQEQYRIVEAIDSHFTRLDDAVATLERVQRNLKRYRASVLKAALEGRLVPTEAELARAEGRDYEPASVLLERIVAERRRRWEEKAKTKVKVNILTDHIWERNYDEPTPPDTAQLPELPEGWCWATSDQVFSFVTSGSRGWAKYYSDSGAIFIRIGNLDHESITLDFSNVQRVDPPKGAEGTRTRVQSGDVLISITADVGMIALVRDQIGDAYINQHVSLARPVSCLDLQYLSWFLAAPDGGQKQFLALQRGATKVGLGLDDIRSVNIPLPPLREQQRIVGEIDRHLSIASGCRDAVSVNELRCQRLRQSILKWAFEGRLVDQDPSDEPGAVLLERIKAERAASAGTAKSRNPRRKGNSTNP